MKEDRWSILRYYREVKQDDRELALNLCRWRVQVPLTRVSGGQQLWNID